MTLRHMLLGGLSALSLTLGTGAANAQSTWLDAYRDALEAAHTFDAIGLAEAQVALSPGDRQAHFALGTAKFFEAVESFGQDMYRYGLKSDHDIWLMGPMPFVRLPIEANPSPEPVSYQKLRESLRKFVTALEAAEAELAKVEPGETTLTLDLERVALDMNANGMRDPNESLLPLLSRIMGVRGTATVPDLTVDFDESDVLWLRAYAHLIAGLGDFFLGYDWQQGYDAVFFDLFPQGDFPNSPMRDVLKGYEERLKAIGDVRPPPGVSPYGDSVEYQEWLKTPEGQKYAEAQTLQQSMQYGGLADLIAFIHLMHWPVEEPDRLAAVHSHLKSMVDLSRQNWASVQAETDTGREWIPNLNQQGVLPGMTIDKDRIEGWSMMLEQFDGILDGRLLIPHWRFVEGVNLKRLLLEPTDFDIVLLLQGTTAVPYLEEGEEIDGATWTRIAQLMGGDFMRYFIWIN